MEKKKAQNVIKENTTSQLKTHHSSDHVACLKPRTANYFGTLVTSPKCHKADHHKTHSTCLLRGSSMMGARSSSMKVPALQLATMYQWSNLAKSDSTALSNFSKTRLLSRAPWLIMQISSNTRATLESLMGHTVPSLKSWYHFLGYDSAKESKYQWESP